MNRDFRNPSGNTSASFRTCFRATSEARSSLEAEVKIEWQQDNLRLWVSFRQTPVLSGNWLTELSLDGQSLQPAGAWELVCRHSHRAVSYLEASQSLTENVTLWRHILLARQDQWLILGEAVTGTRPGMWTYRASFPLGTPLRWQRATLHTEGWLARGKQRLCRILPVFGPEWQASELPGRVQGTGTALEIWGTFSGQGFFAPVWFDFCHRRLQKPCTWRALTVAEDRVNVPPDVAVAYRVQVGQDHWLFYRTLGPARRRSFFSHQLVSSLLFAGFDRQKGIRPVLELVEESE